MLFPLRLESAVTSLSARRAWIEMLASGGVCAMMAVESLSARRAWIEIAVACCAPLWIPLSLSARRAWIEIQTGLIGLNSGLSLSARRAWIEIVLWMQVFCRSLVALRKESVDRNRVQGHETRLRHTVALRKESVDRNGVKKRLDGFEGVALRKESVDRNIGAFANNNV